VSADARQALLDAADDVDRIHRLNLTPGRDASPEDLAWYGAEPQRRMRRATRYAARVEPALLPGIAEWLRALAGGRPA
jgi:hypothetical protein